MAKMTLYDLSRETLKPEDVERFQEEILRGTDRASALVAASLVEGALIRALAAHMLIKDDEHFTELFFDRGAVLGDFASRISMGRAFGVYDDYFRDVLDVIRKVRNTFAHAVRPIDFTHELIAAQIAKIPDAPVKEGLPHSMSELRRRYVGVCSNLEVVFIDHSRRFKTAFVVDLQKG